MAAATFQFGTSKQPSAGGSTGLSFGGGTPSAGIGASPFGSTTAGAAGSSAIKPFGAASTATTTPFQLGNVGAQASGSTTGGFNFSGITAAKTPASGFSGLAAQSTSTPLLSALSQSAAKTPSGFSFGSKTTAASSGTATLGASLQSGSALTSTGLATGTSFSQPGFGAPKTAGITAAATTTAAAATAGFVGLGGTGTSTSVTTTGAVVGVAGKQVDVKDTPMPEPFNEIAEHIKKYVKEQKAHRDEISRMSVSTLEKVREETATLRQTLALVSNSIQRDGCAVENLKMDTTQELKNAEIAQRTNDIPAALQHENIAPQEYFQRLVESFEGRMQGYRKHIEIMESHLTSLSQGQTLTPQDLSEVMHKVHETFIALAAQLHSIHDAVKVQKEHYLNYRKAYFKDTNNVFDVKQKDGKKSIAELGLGPSPFNALSNNMTSAMNTSAGQQSLGFHNSSLGAATRTPAVTFGSSMGIGSGLGAFGVKPLGGTTQGTTGFGALGSTTGGFGTSTGFGTTLGTPAVVGTGLGASTFGQPAGTSTGLNFGASTSTGLGGLNTGASATPAAFGTQAKFQLQRPPQGNKRGKRR